MTREDIEGATYVWNDGSHWHFAHAAPAEHHEFADYCEYAALMAVQNVLNEKAAEFMNAATGPISTQASGEFNAWREFSLRVQHYARAFALAEPLGHFSRNANEHHARFIVGRAMSAVLNEWGEEGVSDITKRRYQVVRTEALRMALSHQAKPAGTIKPWATHRAEKAAAEAAKKKKEEETSSDDE